VPSTKTLPPTQRERVARLYLDKRKQMAEQAAIRMGRPFKAAEGTWAEWVRMWNQRDPNVDEAQAWEHELQFAARALADDPTLDPQKVNAEVPIRVALKVFPLRKDVIRQMGGTTYREWADNADEVERRAAPLRETPHPVLEPAPPSPDQGAAPPAAAPAPIPAEQTPPAPPTMPIPGATGAPMGQGGGMP
jgi:hypothetical protein